MKILFFRQDTVNVIMNTVWGGVLCHAVFWTEHGCYINLQELWLSAQNLHKNQPDAPSSNMGRGKLPRLHL